MENKNFFFSFLIHKKNTKNLINMNKYFMLKKCLSWYNSQKKNHKQAYIVFIDHILD